MSYTIEFTEYGKKKYDEAMELIDNILHENIAVAKDMELSLEQRLAELRQILFNGNPDDDNKLIIDGDFVKGSFSFAVKSNDKFRINGGVILHGFGETFAVELDPCRAPHWSIHT